MQQHNILLLGSGGRECALAWKMAQSERCKKLYIAPGNGGTGQYGENVNMGVNDFEALKTFAIAHEISILLPGPEEPLVNGVADFFKNDEALKHIIVCGPSKEGAQLEGSKAFSKKFMQRHGIPTAAYQEFDAQNFEEGIGYIKNHSLPIVIKADGLAAGKGVVIAQTHEEAITAFTDMLQNNQFGAAGSKVVIEQFLSGIELSVFSMSKGSNYILLPTAKDYKRIGEGDTGLNTGGMGAISPVPFATAEFMQKVKEKIVEPTLKGLESEGIAYQGFLFYGLINVEGEPLVIEYNCRMGDPETEVVMPRLETDLVQLMELMEAEKLNQNEVNYLQQDAATVMLVSGGYPGDYEKGKEIKHSENVTGSILFHAGTQLKNNQLLTSGGRVIAVTSLAKGLSAALAQSYACIGQLEYEGMYYRKDIGYEFV